MANRPSMSINLGIPATPDTDSPELYAALQYVYSALRNLGYALDGYTGNTPVTPEEYSQVNAFGHLQVQKTAVMYVKLTEDISLGKMVNLYNSGGIKGRKAIVSSQPCHAFSLDSGVIGDTIPVCLFGLCLVIAGLTPGTIYYQSGTAGLITATVTAQKIGIALDTDKLWFNPQ